MRTIAFAGRKGGTGKTTSAVHIGWWMARQGKRVLLADLDPQANATLALGKQPGDSDIWRLLVRRDKVADLATEVKGLWLLSGGEDTADARDHLAVMATRDARRAMYALHDALRNAGDWDFIIIDCPPSFDLLSVGAVMAASELAVPVPCQFLGFEGVRQFAGMVAELTESGSKAALKWIIPTFYRARITMSEDIVGALVSTFGEDLVLPAIRESTEIDKATRHGQVVFEYAPGSPVAEDYRRVAERVMYG